MRSAEGGFHRRPAGPRRQMATCRTGGEPRRRRPVASVVRGRAARCRGRKFKLVRATNGAGACERTGRRELLVRGWAAVLEPRTNEQCRRCGRCERSWRHERTNDTNETDETNDTNGRYALPRERGPRSPARSSPWTKRHLCSRGSTGDCFPHFMANEDQCGCGERVTSESIACASISTTSRLGISSRIIEQEQKLKSTNRNKNTIPRRAKCRTIPEGADMIERQLCSRQGRCETYGHKTKCANVYRDAWHDELLRSLRPVLLFILLRRVTN